MKQNRAAVLDLGTNTFKLLIAEPGPQGFRIIFRKQIPVLMGQDGISEGLIHTSAEDRLRKAMGEARDIIEEYQLDKNQVRGVATSVYRSTRNGPRVIRDLEKYSGYPIQIIEGDEEAAYIYDGVKQALHLGDENALLVDIGGGSVEFIICNRRKLLWKKSYEIGGQRLYDQFMRSDPISLLDQQRLQIFLDSQLFELSNIIFHYSPKVLIGSAGGFETLAAIDYARKHPDADLSRFVDNNHQLLLSSHTIEREEFHDLYRDLIRKNRDERLAMPGMAPFRVGMIVVAACLVQFLLDVYDLDSLKISAYSLKEGVLGRLMGQYP